MSGPLLQLLDESTGVTLRLWGIEAASSVGVVEGGVYKYRLSGLNSVSSITPEEQFVCDPDDSTVGRFRPSNHVGTFRVSICDDKNATSSFTIEVRPWKLDYETQYRAMLEQIADHAAEALLRGFAPASADFQPDPSALGELRYRAMAFLTARLRSEEFEAAIGEIVRNPHRRWETGRERRPISHGLPPGSQASRQFARNGRRLTTPAHLAHLPTQGLPEHTDWSRNSVTYDTPANRFVRYVFETWRGMARDMFAALEGPASPGAGPQRRGRTEAEWLEARCSEVLSSPVLAEAGPLRTMPQGDPVLHRQPGYREILRVFALAQASIALDAKLPDDAFSATKQNVATLYEYWCFLVLLDCLNRIAGGVSTNSVFATSESGLSLVLQRGADHGHSWTVEERGRRLQIDLWFNRNFAGSGRDGAEGSWTSSMRPDVSLRIRPLSARPESAADPELDVWLHFDAKYRVQRQDVEFSDDPVITTTRSDLLKMHAYRDAIRRSAGAHVLYPGTDEPLHQKEFHELVPGIGAFPLRPGESGAVTGVDNLERFLREVLQQSANQASAAERTQYWSSIHTRRAGSTVRPASFLKLPPADELVLVGYVRHEQWPWVRRERRYNLRAGRRTGAVSLSDDMLRARLILLWTGTKDQPSVLGVFERVGPWQVATADELAASGYPRSAGGDLYLLTEINPAYAALDRAVRSEELLPHLPTNSQPVAVTWEQIASGLQTK